MRTPVALTSKMPSSMVRSETSNVPAAEVVDQDVALAASFLLEAVSDGSSVGSLMIRHI